MDAGHGKVVKQRGVQTLTFSLRTRRANSLKLCKNPNNKGLNVDYKLRNKCRNFAAPHYFLKSFLHLCPDYKHS